MSTPDASTTPPTTEGGGLALPVAAIVCISIGCYVIVIIAIILIRSLLVPEGYCQNKSANNSCCLSCANIFQRQGKCQCQCGGSEEAQPCCACCLSLNEACNCCKAPSVTGCVDCVCPKRKESMKCWKKVDCMKFLLCGCCSDDPAGPCNCGGGEVDCLCCKIQCHRKDDPGNRDPRLSLYSHTYQLPQGESYMCIVDHQGNLTKILHPPHHSSNLNNSALSGSEPGFPSARSLPASVSQASLLSPGQWGSARILPPRPPESSPPPCLKPPSPQAVKGIRLTYQFPCRREACL